MRIGYSIALLLLMLSSSAWAGCNPKKSGLLFEYLSTPPLLVSEPDSTLVVMVDDAGCAVVHFPAHDLRRGDYQLQLARDELDELRADLAIAARHAVDASGIQRRVKARMLEKGTAGKELFAVRDENLVFFRIAEVKDKQGRDVDLRSTSLRSDLRNLPEDPGLIALGALDRRSGDISQQAHDRGQKVQP